MGFNARKTDTEVKTIELLINKAVNRALSNVGVQRSVYGISGGASGIPSSSDGASTTYTYKSIPYANSSGVLTSDVTNFYWDDGTQTAYLKNVQANLTSGSILFYTTKFAQNNSKLFWDNVNETLGIGTQRSGAVSATNAGTLIKGSGATSATSSFDVQNSSGTSILFVRDDSKVGILTNAPTAPLSVKNKVTLDPTVADSSGSIVCLLDTDNAVTATGFRWISAKSNGTERFYLGWAGNPIFYSATRLDIQSGAGIYLTAASGLSVYADTIQARTGASTSTATQKNSYSAIFAASLWTGAADSIRYSYVKNIASTATNLSHRLAFTMNSTSNNGTGGTEVMALYHDGSSAYRVGIGNTAPSTKLDVTGNFRTAPVNLTAAATVTTDASLSNVFRLTANQNFTLANPTSPVDGQTVRWEILQDATGGRAITWGSAFANTFTLTTTASTRTIFEAFYVSATSKWYISNSKITGI